MNRKDCPDCTRPSFSAKCSGEWLCPICGCDLTALPFRGAEEEEDDG